MWNDNINTYNQRSHWAQFYLQQQPPLQIWKQNCYLEKHGYEMCLFVWNFNIGNHKIL